VGDGYLEATLLAACPGFRATWESQRRAWAPGAAPAAADFLAALQAHLLELLATGRVAEAAAAFRGVERLLGEADPILAELLADHLVRPLAASARVVGVPAVRVEPYVGPRTRRIWREGDG